MGFGLFLTVFATEIANTHFIIPKHKRPTTEKTG